MAFIEELVSQDPSLRPKQLAGLVENKFGYTVHPRSIERALDRRKKTLKKSETFSPNLNECYEELRSQALGEPTAVVTPLGLALLLRKGTAAWFLAWYRPPEAPKAKEPLPEMICSELAMLLAEMLLNRRQKDEQFKSAPFTS